MKKRKIYIDKIATDKFICSYAKIFIPIKRYQTSFEEGKDVENVFADSIMRRFIILTEMHCEIKFEMLGNYFIIIIEMVWDSNANKKDIEKDLGYIFSLLDAEDNIAHLNWDLMNNSVQENIYVKAQILFDKFFDSMYMQENAIHNMTRTSNDLLLSIFKADIILEFLSKEKIELSNINYMIEEICAGKDDVQIFDDYVILTPNLQTVSFFESSSNEVILCAIFLRKENEITLRYKIFSSLLTEILQKELRQKRGLVYYIGSEYDLKRNLFLIRTNCKNKDINKICRIISDILKQIKESQYYIEEREWHSIILRKLLDMMIVQDDPYMLMTFRFEQFFCGCLREFNDYYNLVKNLKKNVIQEICRQIIGIKFFICGEVLDE